MVNIIVQQKQYILSQDHKNIVEKEGKIDTAQLHITGLFTLAPPFGGSGCVRLGRSPSARSHASLRQILGACKNNRR